MCFSMLFSDWLTLTLIVSYRSVYGFCICFETSHWALYQYIKLDHRPNLRDAAHSPQIMQIFSPGFTVIRVTPRPGV